MSDVTKIKLYPPETQADWVAFDVLKAAQDVQDLVCRHPREMLKQLQYLQEGIAMLIEAEERLLTMDVRNAV